MCSLRLAVFSAERPEPYAEAANHGPCAQRGGLSPRCFILLLLMGVCVHLTWQSTWGGVSRGGHHTAELGHLQVTLSLALLDLLVLHLRFLNLSGSFFSWEGWNRCRKHAGSSGERTSAPGQTSLCGWPHLPVAPRDGQDSAGWERHQTRVKLLPWSGQMGGVLRKGTRWILQSRCER